MKFKQLLTEPLGNIKNAKKKNACSYKFSTSDLSMQFALLKNKLTASFTRMLGISDWSIMRVRSMFLSHNSMNFKAYIPQSTLKNTQKISTIQNRLKAKGVHFLAHDELR